MVVIGLLCGFGAGGCNGQDGGNSERAFDHYIGYRVRHQLAGANPAIGC